jgi:cell division protein FtsW
MSSTAEKLRAARPSLRRVHEALDRLEAPTTTYYLLVMVTSTLVVFGLIMVLSASAIESISHSKSQSAYTIFRNQAVFAVLGTIVLLIARRFSVATWKRLALPVLGVALVLQTLVLFVGTNVKGNQNWLRLGPVGIQPSELVKLGLVLFGGFILAKKKDSLTQVMHVAIPYLFPAGALALGLVVLGGDLGTGIVIAAIIAATLYAAGIPGKWFAAVGGAALVAATYLIVTSPHRLSRFDVWLGRDTDPFGAARQPMQGRFALAEGGWWGLGLGASREKWQWLSEPHNDFIFAIIGEELGLPGTLMVLALFGALAYACYRIVVRSSDLFVRLATAGIMGWLIVQALVNIGSVIGLVPVVGVPLPLVSSGGSSLVTTMGALGILMSFARSEPGCAEALAGKPSILRRTAAVVPTVSVRKAKS